MQIKVQPLAISEVCLLEPAIHEDERGYLMEVWKLGDFAAATGFNGTFVQENQSRSASGVLRGLHYQTPKPQGKLVRVVGGTVFSAAVDIRAGSANFGDWIGVELSAENHRQLWVPPGFAHGFLVLAAPADVIYKVTAPYDPAGQRTIRWDDPAIGVKWPLTGEPLLSARDRAAPLLVEAEVYS